MLRLKDDSRDGETEQDVMVFDIASFEMHEKEMFC